jgi:exodeoxyribonuclease VII small subunit
MGDPAAPANFEQALDELEKVVKQLESGDLPLEETLTLFERGVALSDSCRKQLDTAETRIEVLLKRAGEVKPESFDPKNV